LKKKKVGSKRCCFAKFENSTMLCWVIF